MAILFFKHRSTVIIKTKLQNILAAGERLQAFNLHPETINPNRNITIDICKTNKSSSYTVVN